MKRYRTGAGSDDSPYCVYQWEHLHLEETNFNVWDGLKVLKNCSTGTVLTEKYEVFVDTNWFYLQVCVPVRGEGAEAAPGIRRQLFTSPPGAESRGKPWPASFLSIGHWISQVCRILLLVLFNTSPFLSSLWLYRISPLEQLALVVYASLLMVLQISCALVVFDIFLLVLKNNWP